MSALALAMSSAPRTRHLRWFAWCAFWAAVFFVGNGVTTTDLPDAWVFAGTRVAMFAAGLYSAGWLQYHAASLRVRPSALDRALIVIGVALALAAFFPNVLMRGPIGARAVPWLGLVYRDAVPTPLGLFGYAYHYGVALLLFTRYARRWRSGDPVTRAYCVTFLVFVVFGVNDAVALVLGLPVPALLPLAVWALIVGISTTMVAQFLANARALERSSQDLARAHEKVAKQERLAALGELAATVAHEIRNPLAAIYNALASVTKPRLEESDRSALIAIAREEATRIEAIVSSMLDFAKPTAPRFELVDVTEATRRAAEAAAAVARAPGSSLTLAFEAPGHPIMATCDEQLIRQLVINLTNNAFEAEGRRGPVRVRVEERPGAVVIEVIDDGEGVPVGARERIFMPFHSTRATGTGLGLAFVRRAAEAHAGEVSITETPGGGATFTVELPLRPRQS